MRQQGGMALQASLFTAHTSHPDSPTGKGTTHHSPHHSKNNTIVNKKGHLRLLD
ncbi:hypothetical protein T440DRAFT_468439 [Plenodomus tracheiphilus IPT5]|uniref:Uncharacterized protein n=1 Tax=Plenodomus tracheiphilus IPT5 TaxID=1408161 RepID=A0A6A7B537_9PLEO|nr:hypothetical protein T440DRAFT_468439 [Plenodomus tracheiphilus IPT5]